MFCFAFLLLATTGAGAWSIDAPEAARRHDGRGTTSAIWPAALGITLR